MECWCEYNYLDHDSPKAERCPLWYNSSIRIGNQPVFYRKYNELGINYFEDLLDRNGQIYRFDELCRKYHLHDHILHYYSLISALPSHWKNKRKSEIKKGNPNFDKVKSKTFTSKAIYINLMNTISASPESITVKWNENLNLDLDKNA